MRLERIIGPEKVVVTDLNRAGLIQKWKMQGFVNSNDENTFNGREIMERYVLNHPIQARDAWEYICELADEFEFLDKDWFEQSVLERWTFGNNKKESEEIIIQILQLITEEGPFDTVKIPVPTPDQIMANDSIGTYPFWSEKNELYYPEIATLREEDIDTNGLANLFLNFFGRENRKYRENKECLEFIKRIILELPIVLNTFREEYYHSPSSNAANHAEFVKFKEAYLNYVKFRDSFLKICASYESLDKKKLDLFLIRINFIKTLDEKGADNILHQLQFLLERFERYLGGYEGGISVVGNVTEETRDGALSVVEDTSGGISLRDEK